MSVFLIAILLGLATGDFVVAEEPEPKQSNGTNLAVQADDVQARTVLQWHGEEVR